MDVFHKTPFQAALMPFLDRDGWEGRVAMVKATYLIAGDGELKIAEQQEPINFVDRFLAEPGMSSPLFESDGAWFKPATDVVVVANAFPPHGSATRFKAKISCGPLSKEIAVIGQRHWSHTVFGVRASEPEPVSELPICWERCFGGRDAEGWETRNPVGAGYCSKPNSNSIDGVSLPNFENPSELIRDSFDRPAPHGLGFTGRSWEPRVRYAGVFDETWKKTRMPLPPLSFDYKFFNAAPPGLIWPGYMKGGDVVQAINLSPSGREVFSLPSLDVTFHGTACGSPFELPGHLDTVILDFSEMRVIMTFRVKYRVQLNDSADFARAIVRGLN